MTVRWLQITVRACIYIFFYHNWYCIRGEFRCAHSGNSCLSKENNLLWLGQGDASVWMRICSTRVGQPIPSLSSRNGQTPSENRLKSFYFNFIVTTACSDSAFACYAPPAGPSSSSRKETLECSSYRSLTSPGMTAKSQRPFWWNSGPKGFSSSKFKHFLNEVSD